MKINTSIFERPPHYEAKELPWWEKQRFRETDLYTPGYDVRRMGSRIDQFVSTETIKISEIRPFMGEAESFKEGVFRHLERQFRKNLSWYGLIIEDSFEKVIEQPSEIYEDVDVLYFRVKARALCPTEPFDAPQKPKRSYCEHCTSWSFEDKFHSGTCENCGAPYRS